MNSVSMASATCPECGETLSVGGARCVVCGWPVEQEPWQPRKETVAPKKPVLAKAKPQHRKAAVAPIFGVLFALALFNLVMPAVIEGMFGEANLPDGIMIMIGCTLYGVLAAQIGIVAIWGALGPGRLLRRLGQSVLIMATLLIALAIGLAVGVEADADEILSILLLAPLLCVAAQAPLWGARFLWHWRIEAAQPDNGSGGPADVQLRISDLFVGTAAVAVVFALARMSLAVDDGNGVTWTGLVICVLIVMASGLLIGLPCVWGALGARMPIAACFIVVLFGAVASVVFAVVMQLLIEDLSWLDAIAAPLSIVFALIAMLLIVLLVVRGSGYRLAGKAQT